jgi:thioredoxin-like negative regulator of GroEL
LAEIEMLQGTDKSIQKAIDFLTEAIEANPKNIDLQVDLAKACILSGRPKSAMGILEDVTKAVRTL